MSERDGSHVRFKEGDGLVEYEGSPSKQSKVSTKSTASSSPAKPKIARSASISGAITSSPVEGKKKKQPSPTAKSPASAIQQESEKSIPSSADDSTVPVDIVVSPVVTSDIVDNSHESETVDETKLKFFSAFQTINRVHGGAIMKIKLGVAGSIPSKDSFPMFGGARRWTCLHWDAETVPTSWCIAWYEQPPAWFYTALEEVENSKTSGPQGTDGTPAGPSLVESSLFPLPPTRLAVKVVRLCDISDLFMEAAPSTAFRIYCGREVIMMTPVSAYNLLSRRSASWADALYSMMALQAESDAELVLLYKQEFTDLLQHALDQQNQQQAKQAPQSEGNGESGAEGGRRPAMMRRRSSLSSLLGISASKPLPPLDEQGIDPSQDGQDQREHGPQSKKMTFKGAVKMVQGALKRSGLLSRQESASTEENRNSFSRRYLLDRKVSVIKDRRAPMYGSADTGGQDEDGAEDNSAQTTAEEENGSGQGSRVPFQRSPPSSGGAPSSNFLSQSLLSSTAALSPTNRSRSSQAAGSAPADQGSIPEESSGTVLALQDQINALLEQNRALQQLLHPADAIATAGSPTSDQPPSPAAAAAVKYSPEELSTLRNFTSRSNFHQNQHTLKNSQRAFSQAGLGLDGMDRAAFLAARKAKQEAVAVAPVLGKQTVLDILLANTSAAPANIDAGDDYYNDTIELEPQQIEQLIELHKLQQLHLRGEARGRILDGTAASDEGKESRADPEVLPAPPAPLRRRRDSTTSIHFRHELVKDGGGGSPGTRTAPSLFVGPEPSRSQRTESSASLHSAGTGEPSSGEQNPSAEKQEITHPGPPAAEKAATVAATSLHVSSDKRTLGTEHSSPHTATQSPLVQSSPTRPVLVKAASLDAGVQQGMQRTGVAPPFSRHVSAQHVLEYITSDNESSLVAPRNTGAKGGSSATAPSSATRVPPPKQSSKTMPKTPTINERQMLHAIEREGMLLSLLGGGGGERAGAEIRPIEKTRQGSHGAESLHPEQRPRADSKLTSSARSTRSTSSDEEQQYMRTDTAGQGSETHQAKIQQNSAADGGAQLKTPFMKGKVSRMGSGVLQAAGVSSSTASAVLPKSPPRLTARLSNQKQAPGVLPATTAASVGKAVSAPDPLSEGDEREVGNEHLSPPRWDHKDFYQHDRADFARRASRKSGKKPHRTDAPDVESKRDEASSRRAVAVGTWLDRAPPLYLLQATLLSSALAASSDGLSLTTEIALVLLESSEKSGAAGLIASANNALFVSSTEEMTSIPAQGAENWWRKRIQQGGYKAAAARGVHWLALCTTSAVGDEEVLLVSLADVVSAELDSNNTGLFKLLLEIIVPGDLDWEGRLLKNSALRRLLTHNNGAAHRSGNRSAHATAQPSAATRVSLVCKTADTAHLADWLSLLLAAKYPA